MHNLSVRFRIGFAETDSITLFKVGIKKKTGNKPVDFRVERELTFEDFHIVGASDKVRGAEGRRVFQGGSEHAAVCFLFDYQRG